MADMRSCPTRQGTHNEQRLPMCNSGIATAECIRSSTNSREGARAPSRRVVTTVFDAPRDQAVELRSRWTAAAVLVSAIVLVMTPAIVAGISLFSELFDQIYGSLQKALGLTHYLGLARLLVTLGLFVIIMPSGARQMKPSGRSSELDASAPDEMSNSRMREAA